MTASDSISKGVRTFVSDVAEGFFEITHNGFALIGLAVIFAAITLTARPDLRQAGEAQLSGWLKSRQPVVDAVPEELAAVDRATASNPKALPREQAAIAYWLSNKYRVAPEPISALVAEAYSVGKTVKLEPTLILAIMAIESSFNPFAQSPVGAQGLMQVMTEIHSDKYEGFGGKFAAFDPVTNLRVGVKVLQECIARAGSLEGGLKYYVGAANLDHDDGYGAKVLAEYYRLKMVAKGQSVPMFDARPQTTATPVLTAPAPVAVSMPPPAAVGSMPAEGNKPAMVPTLAPVAPAPQDAKVLNAPEKLAALANT